MEVELNGATLHYEIHGDGEPLLWLHGFSGSGADWKHVKRALVPVAPRASPVKTY